jgi:DNA primase
MLLYTAGSLIREKQQKIEKIGNEAWKYTNLKKEAFFHKLGKKLNLHFESKKFSIQNLCICEK